MLRPADSLLYSSRAARRAHSRAERRKSLASALRALVGVVRELIGFAFDTVLLVGLPVLYLAAAWFVVDLPARWFFGVEPVSLVGVLLFVGGVVVSLVGLARALQQAQPLQPVTPQFARRALVMGWVAALLFTIGDIAG